MRLSGYRRSSGYARGSHEKKRHPGTITLLVLALVSGCSLVMETKRPDYTDVSTIQKGTPRYQVTAVFGKPLETYKKDDKDVDIFQADPNGRNVATKIVVNTFNTAADVLTIGLWEVVATPAEMLTKHKLTTYMVTYTPDQKVESIVVVATPPKAEERTAAATSPNASPETKLLQDAASPAAISPPVSRTTPTASTL